MMRRNKTAARMQKSMLYAALILFVFLMDLPLISMVGTSLKEKTIALSSTSLLPGRGEWSIQSYIDVFRTTDFPHNIVNSVQISLATTFFCVIISATAGYALSRFRGGVFRTYSTLLLVMQMFPAMLWLIPMFILYTRFGLINTKTSAIISYTTSNLPFNVMMIRGFFDTIPVELEEAAKVDGSTDFQVFSRIVVPISLPGITTIAIMTFLNSWNEFTYANLILRSPEVQTLTLGLSKFVQLNTVNWPLLMSASAIATVPALIFLLFAQKYLVQGLTAGAVKG